MESALNEHLQPGAGVHEFQITGVLGRGRSSIVYAARDRVRACDVALKEYLPAGIARRNARGLLVAAAADAATFGAGKRLFMREALELARIQHPSLIRVFRAWEHGGTAYRAMPLLSGQLLSQTFPPGSAAPSQEWIERLLRPLLDLLTVLHRRHCTGLDLSPARVFMQSDNRPLLMGMGPRECMGPGAGAQARPADPAWRDLQSLALTALELMAPGLTAGLYRPDFVQVILNAAGGVNRGQLTSAQDLMQALALPERRARVRLNRDLLLARQAATTMHLRSAARPKAIA